MWIVPGAKAIRLAGTPVESCYFAKRPAAPDHVCFALLNFLHQRALWPSVESFVTGIYDDVNNIGASFKKLRLIFDHCDDNSGSARMVTSEIEYIFATCRSLFDLLQETLRGLWKNVRLFDSTIKKRELPKSYADMLFRANSPQSTDQIAERYSIPQQLASVYAQSSLFFQWLREFRDLVSHSGRTVGYVFTTEKGFAIRTPDKPFSGMPIWCPTNSLPNELGSLLSVLAFIVHTTIGLCEMFATVLPQVIQFPPDIAPGYSVYMCGPHVGALAGLNEWIRIRPWYC